MKGIHSQYLGKTVYVDSKGQEVTAQLVQKDVPRNYWKVSIENLIANLGNMTPKAMLVVDYVLRHTNFKNNTFVGTNADISKKCKKVGYTKVATTLSFLASHNVITRRPGRIMWNPEIVNHRKVYEVPNLIIRYRTMNNKYMKIQIPSEANRKRTAKARRVLAKKRAKGKSNNRDSSQQSSMTKSNKIKKPVKND